MCGHVRPVNEKLKQQGFKTHANDVLLWLQISAVFRESNSTADLTDVHVCGVVYWGRGARTVADRMCAVARYYDISSKADRGDIFIVPDQKSSYRTPLLHLIINFVHSLRYFSLGNMTASTVIILF